MMLDLLNLLLVRHEVEVDHCRYFRNRQPSIGILDIGLLERPACGQDLGRKLLHGGSIESDSSDVLLSGRRSVTSCAMNNVNLSEYICDGFPTRDDCCSMTAVQVGTSISG